LAFGQTEEEKRAIMAAKNKIEADSVSLYSRSSRIAEQRRQIEVLEGALRDVHRTLEVYEVLDSTRVGQIQKEIDLRVSAEQKAKEALEAADEEKKKKKTWRKVSVGLAIGLAIETLILFL
jgi:ElaB/YqjD/DUF883 family membrane-anchored ribosome-binding protein